MHQIGSWRATKAQPVGDVLRPLSATIRANRISMALARADILPLEQAKHYANNSIYAFDEAWFDGDDLHSVARSQVGTHLLKFGHDCDVERVALVTVANYEEPT